MRSRLLGLGLTLRPRRHWGQPWSSCLQELANPFEIGREERVERGVHELGILKVVTPVGMC